MTLSAGLWTDLVFVCLRMSDILRLREVSRDFRLTVAKGLDRLKAHWDDQRAATESRSQFAVVRNGIRHICEELRAKIDPDLLPRLANYPFKPLPIVSNTRFMLMNLIQKTHSARDVSMFLPALECEEFACFQDRKTLRRVLQRLSDYLQSTSEQECVVYFREGTALWTFIAGFYQVALCAEDAYFDAQERLQTIQEDTRVVSKLQVRLSSNIPLY